MEIRRSTNKLGKEKSEVSYTRKILFAVAVGTGNYKTCAWKGSCIS
jgi:hypothetical protein